MFDLPGYQIVSQIHDGRRSLIYKGRRLIDSLPVIVKVLKNKYPTLVESLRFQQEYMMLRSLGSYGVVRAYAIENVHHTSAIIMEDFGGVSLDKSFQDEPKDLKEILSIFVKIVQIIEDIHSHAVIHKDINPSNIVWNRITGQVKLIDFGISSNASKEQTELVSPDAFEGTLSYMSPEQTGRMNRAVDYRTDLYSLGVTFYELLTGQLPFSVKDSIELVYAHFAMSPEPVSRINTKIPASISDIILKLLSKMTEHRYQSAFGLRSDLETCLYHLKKEGEIPFFKLGLEDLTDRFQIPQKLFHRGKEIESLLTAYDCISLGAKEVVIVNGYEGSGKSALVREIQKTIVNRGGHFISGKFDRIKRNIPYEPLIHAFRKMVLHLLSENQESLSGWRDKLINTLGINGQVIVDVIPELELIIGKQLPLPDLPSVESRNRFNLVFHSFVDIFSSKNNPLVLFLDDLQWADMSSLKLIEQIMTTPDDNYMLLIGALSGVNLDDDHPVLKTLEMIKAAQVNVSNIQLEPLELAHVKQLLSETLYTDISSVTPLAELCYRKTYGNPLFLNQLLMLMHAEGGIVFNRQEKKWEWDMDKLNRVKISDSAVDLMIEKFQRFPEDLSKLLKYAACIGTRFDLHLLSLIYGNSPKGIFEMLKMALSEGLIEPCFNLDAFHPWCRLCRTSTG